MNVVVHQTPILGVGAFGSVGMLVWASVALVPLLIHLWNRRQHREANWAAMEFLLAAIQEQSKRLRFEQLLLLLLRIAIPCVLAVALADPLWQLLPSQGNSLGTRPPHHHLFLIDTSYSMAYDVDGQTRLAQAQQFARDVIQQSPQGDGFTLFRMSSPSRAIVASPTYAKNDILAEVNALAIHDCAADLVSALRLAKQTLQTTRETHPRLAQHRLYIVSDMAQNTWRSADRKDVREVVAEIEPLAQVVVVDVGVIESYNAAIVSAKRNGTLPTIGALQTWSVSVRSYHGSAQSCDVEMRVDDRLVAKESIQLTDGRLGVAPFSYRFDTAGQHTISFAVPNDSLLADNQRWEVVTIRESVRVLCVEGRRDAARNVALALSPTEDPHLEIRTIMDHRLGNTDLKPFDALFLCNIGSVTSEQATKLRDFLREGGGIVMFLGDQIQPENFNDMLGQTDGLKRPILPAELLGVAPYGRYVFAPHDYRHPLIEPFRGQEDAGLLSTPVWSYVRLRLAADHRARVVLSFRNGDPAIVEHSVLGGRFALVATAPSQQSVLPQAGRSTPWNAWSVWPSFPPMVQELLSYTVGSQDELNNVDVGQTIGGTLPANDVSDYVTIESPRQEEHRVAIQDSLSLATWSWSDTYTSGFYSAELADSATVHRFAVNVADYEESEPTRVNIESLPDPFQQHSIEVAANESAQARLESAPLFRRLLGVLLVLLLTESAVAWYFGNARA